MASPSETKAPFRSVLPGIPSRVRQVHDQHRSIVRQMRELTCRLDEQPGEDELAERRAEIHRSLGWLQSDLAEHFYNEGSVGFVAHALAAAPRLSRRARAIASQHHLLRGKLVKVVSLVERKASAWVEIRFEFQAFSASLQEHEALENELIHEAFLDDLGGGA